MTTPELDPARPSTLNRRQGLLAVLALGAAGLLGGCAALKTFHSEVSTYGTWPAGRAASSFAFDRLPSQTGTPDQQQIEDAAQAALKAAGFTLAAEGATADVLVQIGARVSRQARSPWDDPMWWQFGVNRWNWPRWGGPSWGWRMRVSEPDYEREVAVLIRDRASSQPLYEARARSDGLTPGGTAVLNAMFAAALKDFPAVQPEPHDVAIALP